MDDFTFSNFAEGPVRTYILPVTHFILILLSVMIPCFTMAPQAAWSEEERYEVWYSRVIEAAVHACDKA